MNWTYAKLTEQQRMIHSLFRDSDLLDPDQISFRMTDRIAYARDQWPRSLIRWRKGETEPLPDAIIWPTNAQQTAACLAALQDHESTIPTIAAGGGSAVTGATAPLHNGVVIDLKRLRHIRHIDPVEGIAEVEAGIIGQHLEEALQREGLTLGHFPSSIMCSTLGGWAATRSAGQASSHYGKIEDMIVSLQMATSDGELVWTQGPFDWTRLFVGSEGRMGLITACKVRVHPAPQARQFRGVLFPNLETGLKATRQLMQSDAASPVILRLYNPLDTTVSAHKNAITRPHTQHTIPLATKPRGNNAQLPVLASQIQPKKKWQSLLKKVGIQTFQQLQPQLSTLFEKATGQASLLEKVMPEECLMIIGTEATNRQLAQAKMEQHLALCQEVGGKDLGDGPGWHWYENRYQVSFKQSTVFRHGTFTDTLEVACRWSHINKVYANVKRALEREAIVMAHFSHAYPEGCSIYFTFVSYASPDNELERYDRLWKAGLQAAIDAGASISHHHGIGVNKAIGMQQEWGLGGMQLMNALVQTYAPDLQLNPGKLDLESHPPHHPNSSSSQPSTIDQLKRHLPHLPWSTLRRQSPEEAKEQWGDSNHQMPCLTVSLWQDVRDLLKSCHSNGFPLYTSQGPRPDTREGLALLIDMPPGKPPAFELDKESMLLTCDTRHSIESIEAFARMHGFTTGIRGDIQMGLRQWLAQGPPYLNDIGSGTAYNIVYSVAALLANGQEVNLGKAPRASAGPDLKQLFWQTHEQFGIPVRVTLRLRRVLPESLIWRTYHDTQQEAIERIEYIVHSEHQPVELLLSLSLEGRSHSVTTRFSPTLLSPHKAREYEALQAQVLSTFPAAYLPDHPWWMAVATPHRELPLLQQALQEAFPWKLNQLTLLKMEHEKAIWLTAFDTPTTFDQTPDGHVQFRRAILRFLQSQAEWQPEVWADPRCYSWFHRDSPHTQRLLKLAGLLDPLASLNPQIQHTAVSQETTR